MRLFTLQHLGVIPASQKLESMHRYPTLELESTLRQTHQGATVLS